MTDETTEVEDAPKKGILMPLIIGVVLAAVGGGGGFFAVQSGLIGGAAPATAEAPPPKTTSSKDIAFIAIDPMIISIGEAGANRHLRFRAQLEVDQTYTDEITAIMPRIVDVLNGYLRAIRLTDIEDNVALFRLRAQMLRRVQLVAGPGRVKDVLIQEFVLN
ncbi:MAG: flagellar basal body-associated FliL family protein [Pseudomonadota bacterium]